MNINDKYTNLTNGKFKRLNVKVKASVIIPTKNDYFKGYINRYFTQRVNDSSAPIFEISASDYGRLSSSVLFNTTTLRWRISGSKEIIRNPQKKIIDKGVKLSNKTSIQLASVNIRNLNMYLPNLIQYWKKN